MKTIKSSQNGTVVSGLLEQVSRCLTPQVARRLVRLRADSPTQARVEELAEKCNEGQLTPKERSEYEAYIATSNFIAILQAKARADASCRCRPKRVGLTAD